MTRRYGIIPYQPVEDRRLCGVTGSAAKVYLVICAHARGNSWQAYPSVPRLADLTGHTRRTVQRAITKLESAGLLRVDPGGGRNKANVYHLLNGNSDTVVALSENKNSGVQGAKGRPVVQKTATPPSPQEHEKNTKKKEPCTPDQEQKRNERLIAAFDNLPTDRQTHYLHRVGHWGSEKKQKLIAAQHALNDGVLTLDEESTSASSVENPST